MKLYNKPAWDPISIKLNLNISEIQVKPVIYLLGTVVLVFLVTLGISPFFDGNDSELLFVLAVLNLIFCAFGSVFSVVLSSFFVFLNRRSVRRGKDTPFLSSRVLTANLIGLVLGLVFVGYQVLSTSMSSENKALIVLPFFIPFFANIGLFIGLLFRKDKFPRIPEAVIALIITVTALIIIPFLLLLVLEKMNIV
jgi:hypothetical protein